MFDSVIPPMDRNYEKHSKAYMQQRQRNNFQVKIE